MFYYYLLVHVYCIFIITFAAAMNITPEESIITKPIAELTVIEKPRQAKYLTDDIAVISNQQGCSIVDIKTNTEIKKISDIYDKHFDSQDITIHKNRKEIAFCMYKQGVTVYGIEEDPDGTKKYNLKCIIDDKDIRNHMFSSSAHTILLKCYDDAGRVYLKQHNYKNNDVRVYDIGLRHHVHSLACHPTEKIVCGINFDQDKLYCYSLEDYQSNNFYQEVLLPVSPGFCKYNSDGSLLATGNAKCIIILDPTKKWQEIAAFPSPTKEKDFGEEDFGRIMFYSHNVLATLPRHMGNKIFYWDIINQKKLTSTTFSQEHSLLRDFSFSPDGTKVMITLENKCIILPVPLEVMYEGDMQSALPFLLYAYNQLAVRHHIPEDILGYCKNILLEQFKRKR
ncbi:MAG TPA: WD40 repeat domain-containing protein [Candidatus Babeliales bacterium]|nr:WD40 repeat domain-containing protein [Candidatus Babeliales bacterium]